MDPRASFDSLGFDMAQYAPPSAQHLYNSYGLDGANLNSASVFGDSNDAANYDDDENDPKRRRIARVGKIIGIAICS